MQIYVNKIFKNPIEIIEIFNPNDVKFALDHIEKLQSQGYYLLGYMRYDLKNEAGDAPLIYFEAFDSFLPFEEKIPDYKIGTIVKPRITKEEYAQKIDYIKEQIKNGITYEVIPFNVKNKRNWIRLVPVPFAKPEDSLQRLFAKQVRDDFVILARTVFREARQQDFDKAHERHTQARQDF